MDDDVDAGYSLPLAALRARADLDEVCAVRAPGADDGPTNIEATRWICRFLCVTARKLSIPYNDVGFDDLCHRIISSAQGGKLEPSAYRAVWQIRALLAPRSSSMPHNAYSRWQNRSGARAVIIISPVMQFVRPAGGCTLAAAVPL